MTRSDAPPPRPASPAALFWAFTSLALQGFGGVLAVAQREIVERRGWVSREQFLELLSMSQVLPGPNIVNLGLMLGDRWFGLRGAFAAVAGLLSVPLVIVLGLASLYGEFAHLAPVAGALRGMAAVAAGLVVGTAWKLSTALHGNVLGWPICLAIAALTFVAVAWFRWPLIGVLLVLGAAAVALAWSKLAPAKS
jgi:chromate transporter